MVPLGEPGITVTGRAVWGIRFATPAYGFVFGNGLWVTTDGGEHWSAAAYPGGSVMSLEIIDRQVLAVTMRRGMAGHVSWALLRRPVAGGTWTRAVTQAGAMGNIATQARVAAIVDGTSVLVTGNGGLTITSHTDKTVYVSGNLGAAWKLAGHPSSLGDAGAIGRWSVTPTAARAGTTWGSPPPMTAWSSTGTRNSATCPASYC